MTRSAARGGGRTGRLLMLRSVAVTLLLTSSVLAARHALLAQSAPALQGSWTASAGPNQQFRGTWSALVLPGTGNRARGSWILVNATNQVVLQGVWSAEKSARGWQGTWSARISTGRSPSARSSSGPSFSGTWQAETMDAGDKTLAEALQRAAAKQIAGSWRSGPRSGSWSLKSLR
jgi:hypothetical protein